MKDLKLENTTNLPTHKVEVAGSMPAVEKVVSRVDKGIESIVGGAGKSGNAKSKKVKKGFIFSVSDAISNLLVSKKKPAQNLSKRQKTQLVLKTLQQNEKKILKKISRIASKKHFSAHRLEILGQELRYIKSLINKILQKTIKNIDTLYRKFVLNISDSEAVAT